MRSRRFRALVGVAAAIAGAFIACVGEDPAPVTGAPSVDGGNGGSSGNGGNDSGTGALPDGGSVLTNSDAGDASPEDAAGSSCNAPIPDTNVGTIACVDDAGCSAGKCCYSSTVNASRCYTAAAVCNALEFVCDKASDCPGGHVCCLSGGSTAGTCPHAYAATGSECRPRDGGCGTDLELCSVASACASGTQCEAVTATVSASGGPFERHLGGCF